MQKSLDQIPHPATTRATRFQTGPHEFLDVSLYVKDFYAASERYDGQF